MQAAQCSFRLDGAVVEVPLQSDLLSSTTDDEAAAIYDAAIATKNGGLSQKELLEYAEAHCDGTLAKLLAGSRNQRKLKVHHFCQEVP